MGWFICIIILTSHLLSQLASSCFAKWNEFHSTRFLLFLLKLTQFFIIRFHIDVHAPICNRTYTYFMFLVRIVYKSCKKWFQRAKYLHFFRRSSLFINSCGIVYQELFFYWYFKPQDMRCSFSRRRHFTA